MSYEPGDIVVIEYYPISYVRGRCAEITSVHPQGSNRHPLILALAPDDSIWYVLIDISGVKRAAAHSWLRKVPPVWTPRDALRETHA